MAMTVGDLNARALSLARDPNGKFVGAAELLAWWNEAQRRVVSETDYYRARASAALSAQVDVYSLELSGFVKPAADGPVTLSGDGRILSPVTEGEWKRLKAAGAPGDGSPEYYSLLPGLDADAGGVQRLAVYPAPAAAGLSAFVDYVKAPPELTDDASVVLLRDDHAPALIYYVVWRVFLKRKMFAQAEYHQSMFLSELEKIRREMGMETLLRGRAWRMADGYPRSAGANAARRGDTSDPLDLT